MHSLPEGTMRMEEIMERVNDLMAMPPTWTDGRLGRVMTKACLCGLGQAAPSPVLTTMQHFKDEYLSKFN